MNTLEQPPSPVDQEKHYFERPGKVVETGDRFEHVMAIALDPRSNFSDGVIRCIQSREGDVATAGYIDHSVLHTVKANGPDHFRIGGQVEIKNEREIVEKLSGKTLDFLGIEDPDIWIDEITGLMHLYCTLPFRDNMRDTTLIYLGHAVGPDIHSLEMTMPVLGPDKERNGAKELSIAPVNKDGVRLNLVESSVQGKEFEYSTIRTAIAEKMDGKWTFGETVYHPAEWGIAWAGGHASPGPLLPETFLDLGPGKRLGIMNGREENRKVNGKILYGIFSVGLFVYDFEHGVIDWVSPEPLIRDSEARTITFASQFVETSPGEGTLYAHVDDSFVRAYTLSADTLRSLLPQNVV